MTVGVVIGRFQTDRLTHGHTTLLNSVVSSCDELLIMVGIASKLGTRSNPLDFPSRYAMLSSAYPKAVIVPIHDMPNDKDWSAQVDDLIKLMYPHKKVQLWHGRDSFASCYTGKYPLVEIEEQAENISATENRAVIAQRIEHSASWRAGQIYLAHNVWPRINPTVDILAYNKDGVLMGEKASQPGLLRFPGGYVDISDNLLERAACRELQEETGIMSDITDMEYVCSRRIHDWRDAEDNVTFTTMFAVNIYDKSNWKAADDLSKLTLVPYEQFTALSAFRIVNEHLELYSDALEYLEEVLND